MVIKGLAEAKPLVAVEASASSGHSGEPVVPIKEVGTAELGIAKKSSLGHDKETGAPEEDDAGDEDSADGKLEQEEVQAKED